MSKKGAMKKGFFLLEALLACALLALIVGAVVHHYGQWSRSYKKVMQQKNALAVLTMLLETKKESCPDAASYIITKQRVEIDAPTGSLAAVSGVTCPRPQCAALKVAWQDDTQFTHSVCAIVQE